jgi:hypothetical protein
MTLRRAHPAYQPSYSDPAINAAAVTPSDTVDLSAVTRAIYVGTAGDLKVTMLGGQTVTFTAAPAGWHPICATRVFATDTTAEGIVAAW